MTNRIIIKRESLFTNKIEYFTDDWSFITHTCALVQYSKEFLKNSAFWRSYYACEILYIRIRVSPKIFVQL